MVKSIKSKIIVGVLCLILIIQIGSSWMHFSQVKSLLLLEFSIGTQNLLQPLLVELHEKVKPLLELEVEDISRDELIADFDSYVQIMQTDKFESILLVKKDLTAIGFVNPKGEMVVRSQKISAADEKGKEIVKQPCRYRSGHSYYRFPPGIRFQRGIPFTHAPSVRQPRKGRESLEIPARGSFRIHRRSANPHLRR